MRDERYGTRVSFITHKERVSLIAAQETADTSTAYGCRASLLREEQHYGWRGEATQRWPG